jgi:hypothetical protein
MKLKVPQEIYDRRLARMVQLIEMKAPSIIIYHEARLIKEAYQPNLWHRFTWWLQNTRIGMWWIMLDEPDWNPELFGLTDDGENVWTNFDKFDDAAMTRLMFDIAAQPQVSYDAETHSCTVCHCLWGVYNEGCHCDCHN